MLQARGAGGAGHLTCAHRCSALVTTFLHDPTFWWAVAASVWAVTSEYLGTNPRVRENATWQLLLRFISQALNGRARR